MKKLMSIPIIFSLFFITCKSGSDDKAADDNYEKGRSSIAEIEQKNPGRFLIVNGNDKKNILGQTVVKGIILNTAKMVSFKDVGIKLFFYSKTGALLEEDQEVVYETIAPGASKTFKTKYFAAKGTDSVAIKILNAKWEK